MFCWGIKEKLDQLLREVRYMANRFDALIAAVQKNTDATAAAADMIHGLAEQVRQNATDPEKLNQLAGDIDAAATALSEAVTANTPADPEAPEE